VLLSDIIHGLLILDVWYPGEEGGHAVADVLFGDYNPAGRLPAHSPYPGANCRLMNITNQQAGWIAITICQGNRFVNWREHSGGVSFAFSPAGQCAGKEFCRM